MLRQRGRCTSPFPDRFLLSDGCMRVLSRLLSTVRQRSSIGRCIIQRPSAPRLATSPACDSTVKAVTAHLEAGRLAQALSLIDADLQSAPHDRDLLFARGSTLFSWGRYSEAHDALTRAIEAETASKDLYTKFGWTQLWLGRSDDAAEAMRRATDLAPDDWAAHFGLATVLRAQKRTAESKAAFERAAALDPENPHCLSSLIACEIDLENYAAAERLARRLVDLQPDKPAAHADLGMALSSQGRHDEGVASFEYAEALAAGSDAMGDDAVNFAICLLRAGRTQQALAMLEQCLRYDARVGLHSHYALALLISGRFAEGWRQYEFRWTDEPLLAARPNFIKPQWSGQDLRGKAILLWSEQGFGDFIQFIRYASTLKGLGAKVIVFVREELRELAHSVTAIDVTLGPNEPYPPFDYYIALLSIPRVLGTDLTSIPAKVPYLSADRANCARWARKITSERVLKVGVVWAGSPTHPRDRFRSLPLEHLAQLFDVSGVQFFSLQKGPAAAALGAVRGGCEVVDVGSDLTNFAETAAAIENLDLIIGVDTAVVHLAGALGKAVWTLTATPADWRWLETREDSPWYPTMRLFRQSSPGQWDNVIAQARLALEEAVRRGAVPVSRPSVAPIASASHNTAIVSATGDITSMRMARVAETRHGIMQYFPGDEDGEAVEYYGEHRQLEVELLERLIAPGMVLLSSDAGIGVHALCLSPRIGREGHLFLYEHDPMRRQALAQNLKANRITNATIMRRRLKGVCAEESRAVLRPTSTDPFRPCISAIDLDESIDELRLQRLDWLKIDDGDLAPNVLQGAAETVWRLRPRMVVRVTTDEALHGVAARASEYGYACWRAETSLFNPRNFNNRDRDVHSGRKALALIAFPEEFDLDLALDHCERVG